MVITGSHKSIVLDDAEKLLICDVYQIKFLKKSKLLNKVAVFVRFKQECIQLR